MDRDSTTQRLQKQAADAIRTMIMSGELVPGQAIVERDVADRLGMSRAPVREALVELEQEFIIRRVGSRTRVVAEMSLADLVEMYEVREMLEGMAARLLASRMTEPERRHLEDLAGRLDVVPEGRDEDEFEFHEYIVNHSGNSRLSRLASTVHSHLVSLQTRGLMVRKGMMPCDIQFRMTVMHRDVVDALSSRDPDLAERVTRSHVRENRDVLLRCMLRETDTTQAAYTAQH